MKNRKKLVIVILLLFASVLTFTGLKTFEGKDPENIGPELEYIGKRYTGCDLLNQIIAFGFCGAPKSHNYDYYFATNLNKDDLSMYFTNAKLEYIDDYRYDGDTSWFISDKFHFITKSTNTFTVTFYDKPQQVYKNVQLKKVDKKNVISVSKYDYDEAQNSIQKTQ